MRIDHVTVLFLLVVMLAATPVTAGAQAPSDGAEMRTYGTTSNSVYPIPAPAFTNMLPQDANRRITETRFALQCFDNFCDFVAGVSLPAGAVVTSIELDGCISGASVIRANFARAQRGGFADIIETLASLRTDEFDVVPPACTNFPRTLTTPHTVSNRDNYYVVSVNLSDQGATLHGVRLHYHLQVSPGPAVATFNDVPANHPFFPFIQALVAAGITTGCDDSPPLFCPDGLVTRKQMAAFIARALGLHWAP